MSSTDVSAIAIPVSPYFTHALMGFKGILARPTKQAISDATFISRLISSLPDPYKRCSSSRTSRGAFPSPVMLRRSANTKSLFESRRLIAPDANARVSSGLALLPTPNRIAAVVVVFQSAWPW